MNNGNLPRKDHRTRNWYNFPWPKKKNISCCSIYIYIYFFEFKLLLVLYLNFDLGEGDKLRHRPSGVTSLYVIVWKSHAHSVLYDWFVGFY